MKNSGLTYSVVKDLKLLTKKRNKIRIFTLLDTLEVLARATGKRKRKKRKKNNYLSSEIS